MLDRHLGEFGERDLLARQGKALRYTHDHEARTVNISKGVGRMHTLSQPQIGHGRSQYGSFAFRTKRLSMTL